jgi:hypothetical protein
MAILNQTTTSRTAVDLPTTAVAAAGGGDSFVNDGTQLLYIENTDAVSVTLTVPVAPTIDGQTVSSKTFSIAQNKRMVIGPFAPNIYNDANGRVPLSYSAVTALKVAVLKVGQA